MLLDCVLSFMVSASSTTMLKFSARSANILTSIMLDLVRWNHLFYFLLRLILETRPCRELSPARLLVIALASFRSQLPRFWIRSSKKFEGLANYYQVGN